jgi:hypothetical protein
MNYLVDLRHEHGVAVLKYSGVLRVLEVAQYGYSIQPPICSYAERISPEQTT